VWVVINALITLIGATTVADDYNQLVERLPAFLQWLFSTPWWVPATLATALTVFLVYLSWPRSAAMPTVESLPGTPAGGSPVTAVPAESAEEVRRRIIAEWYAMIDEVEASLADKKGHDRFHKIQDELKKRNLYHRLAHYLSEDVQSEVNDPGGVEIRQAITFGRVETRDQRLLRLLRSSIAGLEKEWGLLGPV
jgi:hypothetical protein